MWKILFGGISELVSGWFTDKREKRQAETAKYIADLNAVSEYDLQAQRNMQHTWKDEYLIILHTFPWWGYIIPSDSLTTRLDMLWSKMDSLPDWWWWIYLGMVISTFGLRFMFKSIDSIRGKR